MKKTLSDEFAALRCSNQSTPDSGRSKDGASKRPRRVRGDFCGMRNLNDNSIALRARTRALSGDARASRRNAFPATNFARSAA